MSEDTPNGTAGASDAPAADLDASSVPPEAAAELSLERFRAELEVFSGPMDLLLHLIRQQEVDILDVRLAEITDRYLAAVRTLQFFDVNAAAEFLVVAATLTELKSRSLLPPAEAEDEEQDDDPGTELVRRLLEYKEFKEAAGHLEERGKGQRGKFVRGVPKGQAEPDEESEALLEDLAVWDLMAAFGEILQQTQLRRPAEIVQTDIPVSVYMDEVRAALRARGGRVAFLDFFTSARGEDGALQAQGGRARVIGIFLALLELFRRGEIGIGDRAADPLHIEVVLAERS